MISINTNYGGLFASKAASQSQRTLDTAMERLSTGKRINYAKMMQLDKRFQHGLRLKIEGYSHGIKKCADAQSLMDTAEGALQKHSNFLLRMRELAVQASNGTLKLLTRTALDAEFQQLEEKLIE